MQAQRRAQVKLHSGEFRGGLGEETFQVARDVRAGAEKVRHHQNVVRAGGDALSSSIWNGRCGEFQIARHDDFVVALFPKSVGNDDKIVVGFVAAASVGDQQYGSCHQKHSIHSELQVKAHLKCCGLFVSPDADAESESNFAVHRIVGIRDRMPNHVVVIAEPFGWQPGFSFKTTGD